MKFRKTISGKLGLFFAILILLAGCTDPSSGTLHEVYTYPKELWGEWIRLDTGQIWYITSNYLDKGSSSIYSSETTSSDIKLKRQSTNVIEVTEGTRKYYLYASRIPNGSFNGTIVGDNSGQSKSLINRSMTGMGGIGITITNLNDKANEINTKTDGSGNFTAAGTISGDEYEVTAGGQSTTVMPNTDGENIGNVTVTTGVNFKTSITPADSNTDMMLLYAGSTNYAFTINIANTGTDDYSAATYTLAFSDGLTAVSVPPGKILGTIEPGKKKSIPIRVNCAAVSGESEYKTIAVTVNDPINLKTWNDSVSLKFNRSQKTFYITSNNVISGVVIVPSAKAYAFRTSNGYSGSSYSASVTVPQYSEDFLVVFSGATADTEAIYSLGVNVPADTDFSGFTTTGNYESNNTEDTATTLQPGNKIMSYLHKNDIDYYKVNLGTQ